MENFTPILSLLGGMLIGLSALIMLTMIGRMAGVSGIFGNLFSNIKELGWRFGFLVAIPVGAFLTLLTLPTLHTVDRLSKSVFEFDIIILIIAAFLVGLGTQLGGGCTSGHGICGISRFSTRSIVAVITFMITAIITVFITRGM